MLGREYLVWSDYFYYDETSPSHIRWVVDRFSGRFGNRRMVSKGDSAGYLRKDGYYAVKLENKVYKVHRIIFELKSGDKLDDMVIDHIDGDKSNNKFTNLRKTSQKQNKRNTTLRCDNNTGKTGVYLAKSHNKRLNKCYTTYVAAWLDPDGALKTKSFSVNKYGEADAYWLACEYRDGMIEKLNALGAGYTDRHGK